MKVLRILTVIGLVFTGLVALFSLFSLLVVGGSYFSGAMFSELFISFVVYSILAATQLATVISLTKDIKKLKELDEAVFRLLNSEGKDNG
jgi:membrane protein implicated in regulation of membrane protease activity